MLQTANEGRVTVYLRERSELARLRAYRWELGKLYEEALRDGNLEMARAIFERRQRIWRAILMNEEWMVGTKNSPLSSRSYQ